VFLVLADLCHPHDVRVERQLVGWNIGKADISEQLSEGLLAAISIAEQVEIADWALRAPAPLFRRLDEIVIEEEYARLEG
jgi:hypothetical protein